MTGLTQTGFGQWPHYNYTLCFYLLDFMLLISAFGTY